MYFDEVELIKFNELLSDKFKYYAHLGIKENNNKEELVEHTKLCLKYFTKLVNEKNIDLVLQNFESLCLSDLSIDGIKLFKELFINTITLHDVGKINPVFQSRKMDNQSIKFNEEFCTVDTKHSIISSVLYLDYFWDKVMTYPAQEKKILRTFMFINSYIISKHHGSLDEFVKYLNKFDEGEVGFKVINIFTNTYKDIYIKGFNLEENKVKAQCKNTKKVLNKCNREKSIYLYTYGKLLYSLLLASDYYSTSEFMNGVEMKAFGGLDNVGEFYDIYKKTDVIKSIRDYEEKQYDSKNLEDINDINILRNEMFLDAEKVLGENIDENIFFLEAPTGSGKSNVSMNLSFKLIEKEPTLKKIYNVYPFNTLVEQNLESFTKIFQSNEKVLNNITVVNSIYPIKTDKYEEENNEDFYSKALLDRQFLNYPIVVTTHVSIFDTMFGSSKESSFGFHQLANSVIILDEIQSYKNIIWTEIISFLKGFSKVLNMKVIIMSATLPNLNLLLKSKENTINLINDREKYFSNPLFKDRVKVSYELMDKENILDELYKHVKKSSELSKKILIEFINKKSAYNFYRRLKEDEDFDEVQLMTGDDNTIERKRILKLVKGKQSIILVATQVVEAGVDIDMDIGYKDISKLDSDEQFMGRINRSCKKDGIVYFFNLDKMESIYKNDIRANRNLSLLDESMKEILIKKNFESYYKPVIETLKEIYNESFSETNIEDFFVQTVGNLNFKDVETRMRLIDDNKWHMSVYLASEIEKDDGTILDGKVIWEEYEELLNDNKLSYSEKEVKLAIVRSLMNNFIYEIMKCDTFTYSEKIGELYYIEDGDKYFDDGKLNKDRFISGVGDFIEI